MARKISRRKAGRIAFEANILDGLADPVILVDEKRQVVDANLAAQELLGPKAKGKNLAELLNAPQVIKAVDTVLGGKRARRKTINIPFPIARYYELSVWDLSPRTPGKAAWAMLIFHDVTAARKVDQMRVDFISNVSHELRSPLSSLVSFIETLRGPARSDAEATERFLAIMETEARRMTHLINDLLTLSKVETDEHIQPSGLVDLHQIIKQATAVLSIRAKNRNIAFNIECPKDLPKVTGNSKELRQIFQNLIDNAINYGYEGTTINISLKTTDKAPGAGHKGVLAAVENQGDGIDAKHIPRITERFYRVDKGRSRSMGGTGLGLAIVKHIISRHRGHLAIASIPKGITTFSVYLPQADLPS